MTKSVITDHLQTVLMDFLKKNKKSDLLTTYLYYLEHKFDIKPVLFIREKTIYQSTDAILKKLEQERKLWRETEIKIQMSQPSVNEATSKIYICPFTGKVFGNNTHPNPQDAIYDWVSNCPENTERLDGIRVKRFFISEDKTVISNYTKKRKAPINKTVYSSVVTGKLFNSKSAVITDFKKNQLRTLSLIEVPSQNRFQIDPEFMQFIQDQLDEIKLSSFVESLGTLNDFSPFIGQWLES